MNFIDRVEIRVKAGDGGNGKVSFRHEKFIDKGGPDGGNGGRGGNAVFEASTNENTLARFRFNKEILVPNGQSGGDRKKNGRGSEDVITFVPVGTVVTDVETGAVLADLTTHGQQAIIAKGGHGGYGNAHFQSSVRQTPRIAELGEPGDDRMVHLELKLIADVGLVGLPNAGKSTFLSVTSNARPEIANYPFTTLSPNLGVVDIDKETSLLMADIPGLIEGAAEGKGLGDEFLRHVERTLVLVHIIDAYNDNVVAAYQTIQGELAAYKVDLSGRPQIVVLNKIEGLDEEMVADLLQQLRAVVPGHVPVLAMSAQAHKGLREVLFAIKTELVAARAERAADEAEAAAGTAHAGLPVLSLTEESKAWTIEKPSEHRFIVRGRKIERFAVRTDFDNPQGVARLRDIMRKMGIAHELKRQGITTGDTIQIGDKHQFDY